MFRFGFLLVAVSCCLLPLADAPEQNVTRGNSPSSNGQPEVPKIAKIDGDKTVKQKVTACCSPIIVNEGDNVSCTCQGQGGNPPADVTWYKDNHKIGETGKEEKTLTLTNVTNGKDHKGYKCVAESHHNKMFQDEVKVEVRVRPKCKPYKTEIKVPEEAYIGEKLVINCFSDGLPAPSFTITHNVTNNIVCKHSRYVKENVDYSDAGMYKCIAKNVLGIDTDSDKLIVKVTKIEKRPSTKSATNVTTTQSTPSKITDGGSGVSPGAIAGICIAVLLLLVIVTVVYCCYKRKEKDARNRGNIHRPIGGNHYELDDEEAIEGDNAYDTLVAAASGSKSSAPEKDTPPPVYAAVDKENRLGNTLYASLDTDAMKPKRESKKERAERAPPADYASIDFAKTAKAAKAEPV